MEMPFKLTREDVRNPLFDKDAALIMERHGSLDAALNSVRMQNSGCSGDVVLGSLRLTHGSRLVDGDAALAQ